MYKQKLILDSKLAEICDKERLKNSGCDVCAFAMALSYVEGRNVTLFLEGLQMMETHLLCIGKKLLHILFLIKWKA